METGRSFKRAAPGAPRGLHEPFDMPDITPEPRETATVPAVLPHPSAPTCVEQTGLSLDLLLQLTLKHMHSAGELTGSELARRLGVRFTAIEPAVHALKSQHHLEIVGGSLIGPASYRYRITGAGRMRAAVLLEHNQYVGFAPVPVARYSAYLCEWMKTAPRNATRARVREAFQHLIVRERMLDQLGSAINAGRSLFLYGPPGNGKTVISQAIRNLLDGDIAIPHALEVEGQIVRLFDPVNHEVLPLAETADDAAADRRWMRCRRPLVTVGGELTLDSLEVTYRPTSGFHHAPFQARANGGVLVIDDLGRQPVEARELLNRWIVPLESRVDFLALQTGQRFALPFAVLLVFATNLRPSTLVDEAFLRRIHYKVLAESPTAKDFCAIFEAYCRSRAVPYDSAIVEGLLSNYFRPRAIPLRGCQPRDLIDRALSLAEYLGEPRRLTTALLETACHGYFVKDSDTAPTYT
jgi:predicted ATPase with chaperone activity